MTTDLNGLAVSDGLKAALGHYRLVAEIGRGGMANVFLALFPNADGSSRQVVLKQLQADLAREHDFRALFENEAFLATRFHHENVVETYDIYVDRDLCVLVMEFLDGQTLSRIRQRAKQGSQVPFAIHLRVLADALAGLHYVHELRDQDGTPLGIVHRDVTPSNIFVTYDGRAKVVDFGIAKATIRDSDTRVGGVVKGKLGYMSPEAVRNEQLDRRSDIFSVGVMLWEAAIGRRLWHEHDEVAVFRRLVTGDLPVDAPVTHSTGAEMLRIAKRALAVDPSERYATAEEMRLELESLMRKLGEVTERPSIAGYMNAFFSVERQKFQAIVGAALARFPSHPIPQNRLLRNEVSSSYPGIDSDDPPTTVSSSPTAGGTFRTATATYDIVEDESETPNFRRRLHNGFGLAFVAAAAALGIAYAAHAPNGAAASAARAPVTLESAESAATTRKARNGNVAAFEHPHVTMQAPPAATQAPPAATQAPLAATQAPFMTTEAPPVATQASLMATQAPAAMLSRAPAVILAVFVARPAFARLFLDDVPLEANPATVRRQPDGKRHLLRVEAPGYATLVRPIELDRDVAKEFELAPEGAHAVVAHPTAPPSEPRVEPPRTRPAVRAPGREDPWGI